MAAITENQTAQDHSFSCLEGCANLILEHKVEAIALGVITIFGAALISAEFLTCIVAVTMSVLVGLVAHASYNLVLDEMARTEALRNTCESDIATARAETERVRSETGRAVEASRVELREFLRDIETEIAREANR